MSGQRRNKRHKSIETSHSVGTVQLHVTVAFVWFHVLKYSVFRLLRMLLTSLNLFDMSWRSLSCIKSAKRVCTAMPLLPCPSQALSEPLPRVKLSMKPPPIMAQVIRDSVEEIRSGHMQSVLVSNCFDVERNSILALKFASLSTYTQAETLPPAVKDLRARHFNTSQFQFQGVFFLRIPDKWTNPSQPNACRTSH